MATEYIKREDAKTLLFDRLIETANNNTGYQCDSGVVYQDAAERLRLCWLNEVPAADVVEIPKSGIGDLSDGYHTFNGLYYQRMVLFAALVKAYKGNAWKSWKHENGEPCFGGGWFIVGIDTPQGSYTYHYEDKYWNWFECEELPVAKHWDGHTEKDVARLMSIEVAERKRGYWGYRWKIHGDGRRPTELFPCSECGFENTCATNYCPNCGADMRGDSDV